MAKSGFDRTITQPPKLFQLRKLEIQQSLRIDSTVYLIYWWWFPTPVVRCAVSHNSDVPKVTPYFVCKLLFMGIASFYTLLRNNRINWNVQCWSMLKLILSQGSKRDSLVQPGDFPGEVPPSSTFQGHHAHYGRPASHQKPAPWPANAQMLSFPW